MVRHVLCCGEPLLVRRMHGLFGCIERRWSRVRCTPSWLDSTMALAIVVGTAPVRSRSSAHDRCPACRRRDLHASFIVGLPCRTLPACFPLHAPGCSGVRIHGAGQWKRCLPLAWRQQAYAWLLGEPVSWDGACIAPKSGSGPSGRLRAAIPSLDQAACRNDVLWTGWASPRVVAGPRLDRRRCALDPCCPILVRACADCRRVRHDGICR